MRYAAALLACLLLPGCASSYEIQATGYEDTQVDHFYREGREVLVSEKSASSVLVTPAMRQGHLVFTLVVANHSGVRTLVGPGQVEVLASLAPHRQSDPPIPPAHALVRTPEGAAEHMSRDERWSAFSSGFSAIREATEGDPIGRVFAEMDQRRALAAGASDYAQTYSDALKKHTLMPDETITGNVYVRVKAIDGPNYLLPAERYRLIVPVAGEQHEFHFALSK